MKIYIDGSGWNGRESKYAIALENGDTIIERNPKKKTNNQMEYYALIGALLRAKDGDVIYTDSQLVKGQMTGGWKITKPHLFRLNMIAQELMKKVKVEIVWIPRNENKAGHLLE